MRFRFRIWILTLSALLLPAPALAQSMFSQGGTLGWLPPLFRMRYPTAFDYILLVIGPGLGVVIAVFYYRGVLLDAVKDMHRPARVKFRAVGLGILAAALVLLLAPNLPTGWLLVFALMGAIMAASFGLSLLIAAALIIAAIIVVVVKVMHLIH